MQAGFISSTPKKSKAKEPKLSYHAEPYVNPAGPQGLSLKIRIHYVPCEISPHIPSVKRMALLKTEPFHNWQEQMEGNYGFAIGIKRFEKPIVVVG